MSSTHCSRNNSENDVLGLNDDEIQEELLNADLKALGIVEDEIKIMTVQEKQNLLTAIKQSTSSSPVHEHMKQKNKQNSSLNSEELDSKNSSSSTDIEKNEIVINADSLEEYPSLQTSFNNKKCVQKQKQLEAKEQPQQQPKKIDANINVNTITSPKKVEPNDEDSGDEYLSDYEQYFNFPGFIDDNGIVLNERARKKPLTRKVHYYALPGQSNKDAVKSMLSHYNAWYKLWCSLEKCNNSVNETKISDDITNYVKDTVQSDVLSLQSDNNQSVAATSEPVYNNDVRSPVKYSSPDIEEIEITDISDLSKCNLLSTAKAKTLPRDTVWQNEQVPRKKKHQKFANRSSTPTIALNFDEKWDPATGTWNSPPIGDRYTTPSTSYSSPGMITAPYSNSLKTSNREKSGLENLRKRASQEAHYQPESPQLEPKVQCPICQLDFLQSKVENHAAICEGFPPETRSNSSASPFVLKIEDSNSKNEVINNTADESGKYNSEFKIANKRRAMDSEDKQSTKRVCMNRI